MSVRGRGAAHLAVLLLVLAAAWVAAGCGGGSTTATLPEAGSRFGAGDATTTATAAGAATVRDGAPRPAGDAATAARAAGLIAAGFAGTTAGAQGVRRAGEHGWAAVVVQDTNGTNGNALRALTAAVRRAAMAAGRTPPSIVAAPEVAAAVGELPAQPDVAAPAAARAAAHDGGRLLRAAGITVALDPSADVGWAGGAWEQSAFSADPDVVAAATVATVDGWRAARVAPVPGHFPGEGGASGDPSLGPATVGLGLDGLRAADLKPFEAVATTAPAIQMSAAMYAAWDGVTPASILPDAVRLLREIGFRGAVVSADLNAVAAATGGSVADAAVDALKAGCDLLLIPGDAAAQDAAVRRLADAIRRHEIPEARVRDAEAHVAALREAAAR